MDIFGKPRKTGLNFCETLRNSPNNIWIGCIWKCHTQFSRRIFHLGRIGGVWVFDHPVYFLFAATQFNALFLPMTCSTNVAFFSKNTSPVYSWPKNTVWIFAIWRIFRVNWYTIWQILKSWNLASRKKNLTLVVSVRNKRKITVRDFTSIWRYPELWPDFDFPTNCLIRLLRTLKSRAVSHL